MKKVERMSNFELLRIIAMIMIIISHIFIHAIYIQMNNPLLYGPGEMFNNLMYYRRLCCVDIAFTFGKVGVGLFMLISGYFLCVKKEIKLPDRAKKVISQIVFAALIIIPISMIFQKFIDNSLSSVIGINIISGEWWFISFYLIILIIYQMFINKKISKINQSTYIAILLALFVLSSLQFTGDLITEIAYNLKILVSGFFYFLLGGYIKKYNPFKNIRGIVIIAILLITFVLIAVSYRNAAISDINNTINNQLTVTVYQKSFYHYIESSIPVIVVTISLFELFRIIEWIPMFNGNLKMFIGYILLIIIIVLISGIIIYSIYKLLNMLIKTDFCKKIIYKKSN